MAGAAASSWKRAEDAHKKSKNQAPRKQKPEDLIKPTKFSLNKGGPPKGKASARRSDFAYPNEDVIEPDKQVGRARRGKGRGRGQWSFTNFMAMHG
eukprot:2041230-Pleurochrysis_carterae.AAC.4